MSKSDKSGLTLATGRVLQTEDLALLAVGMAMERLAFQPIVIDLRPQEGFTEFFAVVSAKNARHVAAVAEAIRVRFRALGMPPLAVDGLETGSWVLLDFGAFFVHVFQEATREHYKLEQLWSKGRFVEISEDHVKGLLTEAAVPETPAV